MTENSHPHTHKHTVFEIELVLQLLIDTQNSVAETVTRLKAIATNPDDENAEHATSFLEWMNASKQKPKNRVIYDLRRVHYSEMLEMLLEQKGIKRLIKIIDEGEEPNAQKAIDTLHNITKGKPVQKVELSGFVTHSDVQQALEGNIAELPKSGDWENPEDSIEEFTPGEINSDV